MKLNNEIIEKARTAETVDELAELARANGMALTEQEARSYFEQLHPTMGELSDDELDNVAGGGGCDNKDNDQQSRLKMRKDVKITDTSDRD